MAQSVLFFKTNKEHDGWSPDRVHTISPTGRNGNMKTEKKCWNGFKKNIERTQEEGMASMMKGVEKNCPDNGRKLQKDFKRHWAEPKNINWKQYKSVEKF